MAAGLTRQEFEHASREIATAGAHEVRDVSMRRAVAQKAKHNVRDDEVLFELRPSRALHTTWMNPRQPDTYPVHKVWRLE